MKTKVVGPLFDYFVDVKIVIIFGPRGLKWGWGVKNNEDHAKPLCFTRFEAVGVHFAYTNRRRPLPSTVNSTHFART